VAYRWKCLASVCETQDSHHCYDMYPSSFFYLADTWLISCIEELKNLVSVFGRLLQTYEILYSGRWKMHCLTILDCVLGVRWQQVKRVHVWTLWEDGWILLWSSMLVPFCWLEKGVEDNPSERGLMLCDSLFPGCPPMISGCLKSGSGILYGGLTRLLVGI
jgi:hypothetical protein